MKRYTMLAVLLVCVAAQAQAPMPIPGEPHHHLVFENAYVRVFDVEVPGHEATFLHRHEYDYVYVVLGDSEITNAVLGKPEAHVKMRDAMVRFARGGFAHVARTESDAAFRNVTIELLHAQNIPRNLCAEAVANQPLDCASGAKVEAGKAGPPYTTQPQVAYTTQPQMAYTTQPQMETDEARVNLIQVNSKEKTKLPASELDRLLVALDKTDAEIRVAGKTSVHLRSGGPLWLARGEAIEVQSAGEFPARFLTLDFKNSGATPPAPTKPS